MRSVETVISLSDTRGYGDLLAEGEVVVKVDRLIEETRVARAQQAIWHDEQIVLVWIDTPAMEEQPEVPATTMADIWPKQ